jgi:Pyridoxamine 5'-phosphate oxidase
MIDPKIAELLESGCSICVATVGPDGAPHASRGYGLTVMDPRGRVRLLLDADDRQTRAHLAGGGPISVTGVSVPTLRAVQLKGTVEEPTVTSDAGDIARAAAHMDSLISDIHRMEGTPKALLERLRPSTYAVCTVTVDEIFDQTPGPEAGSRLRAAR